MSRRLSVGINWLSPICIFLTHISSIIIFLSCHFMATKQQQQCLRHGIYNYWSSKTKQAVIPYRNGFVLPFWRKKGTFSFLNIFPRLKYVDASVLLQSGMFSLMILHTPHLLCYFKTCCTVLFSKDSNCPHCLVMQLLSWPAWLLVRLDWQCFLLDTLDVDAQEALS